MCAYSIEYRFRFTYALTEVVTTWPRKDDDAD